MTFKNIKTEIMNKNRLSDSEVTIIVIILAFFSLTIINVVAYEKTESNLNDLEQKIDQRQYIDSLYFEHVSRCSFILKDDVKVDSRGYLYDSYHKNWVK